MFDWFSTLTFLTQFLIVFLVIINSITFFLFGFDKMRSRGDSRRIPEKTLWLLSLLGGTPAALLAMNYFRHKTKKLSFQMMILLILCIQIASIFFLYNFFETTNNPIY